MPDNGATPNDDGDAVGWIGRGVVGDGDAFARSREGVDVGVDVGLAGVVVALFGFADMRATVLAGLGVVTLVGAGDGRAVDLIGFGVVTLVGIRDGRSAGVVLGW